MHVFKDIKIQIWLMLIRSILTNSARILKPLIRTTTQCRQLFNNGKIQIKRIQQIHSNILKEHKKLKPEIMVKMLHLVHFKSLDVQVSSILREQQLQKILHQLSKYMTKLNHDHIVLLLETMSQFQKYARYNKKNEILLRIYKRIQSLRHVSLSSGDYFRMLSTLEKMQFPSMLIIKYVSQVIKLIEKIPQDSMQPRMPTVNYIKFFISIIEIKYIPIQKVDAFFEKQIKNRNFTNPKELTLLYYLCKTIQKSIKEKIQYLEVKLSMRQIIFNPFATLSSQSDSTPEHNSTKQPEQPNSNEKQIMIAKCLQFKKKIINHINEQRIKSTLCKFYQFEKYPLDSSSAFILCDIPELMPCISDFTKKNYLRMQPFQFIVLLGSLKQQERISHYNEYKNKVWTLLSIEQKLKILKAGVQHCNLGIKKQDLLQVISESTSITTKQFQVLSFFIVKYLKSDQHLEVIRAIDQLIDQDNGKGGKNAKKQDEVED